MSTTDKNLLPLHEVAVHEDLGSGYAKLIQLERAYKKGTRTHSDPDRWAIEQFNQDPWCFFTELVNSNTDYSRLDEIYDLIFKRAIEGGVYQDNTYLFRYFTEIVITPQLNVLYRGLPDGKDIESAYFLDNQGNYVINDKPLGIYKGLAMPDVSIWEQHRRRIELGLSPLIKLVEKNKAKCLSIELPKLTDLNLLFNSFPIASSNDRKDQHYFLLMKNNRNAFFTKSIVVSYSAGYGRLNPREGMLDDTTIVPISPLDPTTESNRYLIRTANKGIFTKDGLAHGENSDQYDIPASISSMKFYDLEYCCRESSIQSVKTINDNQGRKRIQYDGVEKREFAPEEFNDRNITYFIPPFKIDCPFYYADYALFLEQLETYRAENKLQWWQFYFDVEFNDPIEVPHKTKSYLNATFIPVRYSWDNEHVKAATNGRYKSIYDHWAYEIEWKEKEANHPRYREEAVVYAELAIKNDSFGYGKFHIPLYRSGQDGLILTKTIEGDRLTSVNNDWSYPSDISGIAKTDLLTNSRYRVDIKNIIDATSQAYLVQYLGVNCIEYLTSSSYFNRNMAELQEDISQLKITYGPYGQMTREPQSSVSDFTNTQYEGIRTYTIKSRALAYLNLDEYSIEDDKREQINRYFPHYNAMKTKLMGAYPDVDQSIFSDHKWGIRPNHSINEITNGAWFNKVPPKYQEYVFDRLYLGNGYYRIDKGAGVESKWNDPKYYDFYMDCQAYAGIRSDDGKLTATPVFPTLTTQTATLYNYQPSLITKVIPVEKLPRPEGNPTDQDLVRYLGYNNQQPIKSAYPFGIVTQSFSGSPAYLWSNIPHDLNLMLNLDRYMDESKSPNAFHYGGPCFEWKNIFIPLVPVSVNIHGVENTVILVPMGAYVKHLKTRTNGYIRDIRDMHLNRSNGLYDVFNDRWKSASRIPYRIMSHPLSWIKTFSPYTDHGDWDPTGMKSLISYYLYYDLNIDRVKAREFFSTRHQYQLGVDAQYRTNETIYFNDRQAASLTHFNKGNSRYLDQAMENINGVIPEVMKWDISNNDVVWTYYGFKTGYFDLIRKGDVTGRGSDAYQQYLQILADRKLKPRTPLTEEEQDNWSYWKEPLILEILDKFVACMQDENQRWSNPTIMRYLNRFRETTHLMSALGWYLDEFDIKNNLSDNSDEIRKVYCLVRDEIVIDFGENNEKLFIGENYLKKKLEHESVRHFQNDSERNEFINHPLFRRIGYTYDEFNDEKINDLNRPYGYYDFAKESWATQTKLGYLHFAEIVTTPIDISIRRGIIKPYSIYTNDSAPSINAREYDDDWYRDEGEPKENAAQSGKIAANDVWSMYYRVLPVFLPIARHHKYHIEPYIVSIYLSIIREDPSFLFNDEFVEHIAVGFGIDTMDFYKQYPPNEIGIKKLLNEIETRIRSGYRTFMETPNEQNRWLGKYSVDEVIKWLGWFKPTYEIQPLYTKGKVLTLARYEDLAKLHDCYLNDYPKVVRFIKERSDYAILIDEITSPDAMPQKMSAHISGARILHDIFESKFSGAVNGMGFMGYEIPDNIRWDTSRNRGRVRPLLEFIRLDQYINGSNYLLTNDSIAKTARPSLINHVYSICGAPIDSIKGSTLQHPNMKSFVLDTFGIIELTSQEITNGLSIYDWLFYLIRTSKINIFDQTSRDMIKKYATWYDDRIKKVVANDINGVENEYLRRFVEKYNDRKDIRLSLREVNLPNTSYNLIHHRLMENETGMVVHPYGKLIYVTAERDTDREVIQEMLQIERVPAVLRGTERPFFLSAFYHGNLTAESSIRHNNSYLGLHNRVQGKVRNTKQETSYHTYPLPILFHVLDYSNTSDTKRPYVYRWSPLLKDNKGKIKPSPLSKVRHPLHPLTSFTKNVDWFTMMTSLEVFLSNELEELHMASDNVTVPPHFYYFLQLLNSMKIPAFDCNFKFNEAASYYCDPMITDGSGKPITYINPLSFFYNHNTMKMVDHPSAPTVQMVPSVLADGSPLYYAVVNRDRLDDGTMRSPHNSKEYRNRTVPNYFYGAYDGVPAKGSVHNLLNQTEFNRPSTIFRLNLDESFVVCIPRHFSYSLKLPRMDIFDVRRTNDSRLMQNNINPFAWGLLPWYQLNSMSRQIKRDPESGNSETCRAIAHHGFGTASYLANRDETWFKVKPVAGYAILSDSYSLDSEFSATVPE